MNEERNQILSMLGQGKITVEDAERLLDAVGATPGVEAAEVQQVNAKPKYLYVVVEGGEDDVNIRVPLQLLRAGMKLTSLIPESAKKKVNLELNEKGIDFDLLNAKPEMLDDMITSLTELEVNVNEKSGEKVRVYCK